MDNYNYLMMDHDYMSGLMDLPTQNPYEDPFSLFLDTEKFSDPDTSPLSEIFSNPQQLDKQDEDTSLDSIFLSYPPISSPISDPLSEIFITPSRDSLKAPLTKNDSSKVKEKNNGSLKEIDPLPDPLKECDPIKDGRKVKEILGKRNRDAHSLDQIVDGSGLNKELMGTGNSDNGSVFVRLMEVGMSAADAEKAMSNARLAELALSDPKKAKRVWVNRQSAAKSKDKRAKYIGELEKRVDSLRQESVTLTAHVDMLQRDTNELALENNQLTIKMRLMEQHVSMQNSLSRQLRAQANRLRIATGQVNVPVNNASFRRPQNPNCFNGQSCTNNNGVIYID